MPDAPRLPHDHENEVLHVTPLLRLLPTWLCVCLLAACDVSPDEAAPSPLEAQAFAASDDGFHTQGTWLHGTPISSVSFSGASVKHEGAYRGAALRLLGGELVASMPLQVSGTTPSLEPCQGIHQLGATRGCGFTVEGQGVCTPGTTVLLSSGACGLAGSCMGNPVVRVCSGERPCEYADTGFLAHGDDVSMCQSLCPNARFTCPASGVYTVLAGPHSPGNFWSVTLAASSGRFPATSKEVRGAGLVGARLQPHMMGTFGYGLEVTDAVNAASVTSPEAAEPWDASGHTFLYRVRIHWPSGTPTELCAPSAGTAGWAWAVPVRGLFDAQGGRQDSSTGFTLGCDAGVIAKCYRWGYKPWLDGAPSGAVTAAHHACTRMARADYCGNGTSYTQDGTSIRLWDSVVPNITPAPTTEASAVGMTFEAGWKTTGPACLSHWRWKHLTASCVNLTPPAYDSAGRIVNDCRDLDPYYGTAPCSQICDSAQEAEMLYGARLFNESALNGLSGDSGP